MKVAIIGAGISGLATAHELRERGVDVAVFEATDEPGGVIRSREVDGHVLELGPQRLRGTPGVESYLDTFGLVDQQFEGADDQPLFVYRDGRLRVAPLSIREAITTDLISWRGKARILAEPLTGPADPGESVAEFFARSFGPEAARTLFSPLYTGLYGASADEMLVRHSVGMALDRHGIDRSILLAIARNLIDGVDLPPIVSLRDGLQQLPAAISDRYDASIHYETPVRAVRTVDDDPAENESGDGSAGDGFVVETDDGQRVVDRVVVTTPGPTAGGLLDPMDPDLGSVLGDLTYNPLAVVHLESAYGREGHGCQILDGEGYETLGMTWNASMLDRDGVYTCYVGGSRSPELVERSDGFLGDLVAREFESLTGFSADPLDVCRWRPGMPAYDASWNALDRVSFPDGIHVCATFADRAGVIGRLRDAERTAEAVVEGSS